MKLSDIDINEVRIGDKVSSPLGIYGHITNIIHMHNTEYKEDYEIEIKWLNGAVTLLSQIEAFNIVLVNN